MGDLFHLIADIMDTDARLVQDTTRFRPEKSEVRRLKCDNSKLKAACGFEPKVPLREGDTYGGVVDKIT